MRYTTYIQFGYLWWDWALSIKGEARNTRYRLLAKLMTLPANNPLKVVYGDL